MFGVIEGFYGPPWTWTARAEVLRGCHQRGLDLYLYGPKDDPLHRERWRDPYPPEELDGLAGLVAEGTMTVGFAISPGLSIDVDSAQDRAALGAKVDQLLGVGITTVALLLDDIPVRPGLGPEHASLTAWLHDHLGGRASLILVPTEYAGTRPSVYLDALAEGVPADVPIGWTGRRVVCDEITVAEAEARAEALGGRAPFVWDNYPVNDGLMADRLFLGPLRGRQAGLLDRCSGYVANPMVQPRASMLPLASMAAWVRGEDPLEAWRHAATELGWLVLAQACDGARPAELVASVIEYDRNNVTDWMAGTTPDENNVDDAPDTDPLDGLDTWLREARHVEAPGLEDEAGPWLEQTRAEARVGRAAVRLLRRLDDDPRAAVGEEAMGLALGWQELRRSRVTVMGSRCSVRPILYNDDHGEWQWDPASLEVDASAIDRLVRYALGV
jgi:hyaluronoglucosaminidase